MTDYLCDFHYQLLKLISESSFIQGTKLEEMFPDDKLRFQATIYYLVNAHLIDYSPTATEADYMISMKLEEKMKEQYREKHHKEPFSMCYHLFLTESGHIVFESYSYQQEIKQHFQEELGLMKQQTRIAIDIADSSKKDARISTILSICAIIIAFTAPFLEKILDLYF